MSDANETITLSYSGRGIGYEKVVVDYIDAEESSAFWFVPRFEIERGTNEFVVEVRVWPWLTIRSLTVEKNGEEIYSEGSSPYQVSILTEATQVIAFMGLLLGPLLLIIMFAK